MRFEDFLTSWIAQDHVSTDDVLAAILPLVREVIETHRAGQVAPLMGLQELHVEQPRIWFEEAKRLAPRDNASIVKQIERPRQLPIEVLAEARRESDLDDGQEKLARLDIAQRGEAITRPVYLPGYVAWEHELDHHDPLTDIFSLGMLLASLACQLNLSDPADLELFVTNRRNLFAINPRLHPAIAQAILRMTELVRHDRAQDLTSLLGGLENYRDQTVSLEIDIARMDGFRTRDVRTKQQLVLTKLRDRLFDISRRNTLLHFRPTLQSINLTQASMPLMLDIRNIREDQVLVWSESLRQQLVAGKPISLNKYLNFNEALYLPSLLERIIADARRDQNEFGFAQLRLALCFLSWANLKEKPVEQYVSPLALLPVRLIKNKGVRDTYSLEPLSTEAEINPVVRHQFQQLYNITLPESIDLETTPLETLYEFLSSKIQASEPAVSLSIVARPRIDLIHEKAKRRLDQYRRNARVSGRGVRHFGSLDYSYDPANYHPLGIKLFSTKVRAPSSHLRELVEEKPRPRSFVAPQPDSNVVETERSFYQLRDTVEANPYLWNFDLCNLTLANFHYRRMSLVRDYERILETSPSHEPFEATFSLAPRPVGRTLVEPLPLDQRFDVVPCDPTQTAAIAEARLGANYIIQGPPGTGKSQTITNLIADYVARGKSVLFVCEKRAAIDVVYARLRQTGLGMLCSLIHDSQTDKKEFVLDLKQTYEQLLAETNKKASTGGKRTTVLRHVQQSLMPLETFEAEMQAEVPSCTGLSVRHFLARCVELLDDRTPLAPEQLERLPEYHTWWENADRLAQLDPAIRDLEPSGVLAKHPLRRLAPEVSQSERPIEQVMSACQQALASLEQLQRAAQSSGLPLEQWSSLRAAQQILDYAQQAAPIARGGNISLVEPSSDRANEFTALLRKLHDTDRECEKASAAAAAWRIKLSQADLQTALEQARGWNGKWFAWLSPAWWRLRGVLARSYDFSAHSVRPTWLQILTSLENEYEAEGWREKLLLETRTAFSLDDDPRQFHERMEEFRRSAARLPDWLRRVHTAILKSPKAATFVERILAADAPASALAIELKHVLANYDELSLDQLRTELQLVQSAARQVPSVLNVLTELQQMPPEIGRTLQQSDFTLAQAEAAIAFRSWDHLLRVRRGLKDFDGRSRSRTAARLEAHYDKWQSANAAEILQRVKNRFLDNVRLAERSATQLSPDQREFKRRYSQGRRTLEHEFGKSMRFKAIRELVEGDAALVIRDLKPVWLMSPLSVSDTLPLADELFDVVIFDEASQVPLEESVPTIFRGKQVIVVGDEMQLPPTDFFSAKQPEEDDEMVIEEAGQRLNHDLDSDSLLNHAARNLPSTMLGWHYRSRSEALISFSNWAFYDGRLLTVPDHELLPTTRDANDKSAAADTDLPVEKLLSRAVSFHFLPDGVYDQRQNRREAEYIAELVRDLLRRDEGLTIGVVAFSEAQQTEIEAALSRLARDDDEFRGRYESELEREIDGQFVGLLVKNLENIQGDERDVVILSICYGPGPTGRMLMNFGPINKSGGEKRLNVAFSRAKHHMAIVSSIHHTAITNDYNDGAACLKNYLRYAEALSHGELEGAKRVLNGIGRYRDNQSADAQAEDPVCRQLAAALRERGYLVEQDIGQSHFRVDLAVRRAEDRQHRLGILVDTATKYENSAAMEREVLRPRLLRNFGWNVAIVLAADWYANREQELQRIKSLLENPEATEDDFNADESDSAEPPDQESESTSAGDDSTNEVLDLDGDDTLSI